MDNLKELHKDINKRPTAPASPPKIPDFIIKAGIIGIAAFLTYLSTELNNKLGNKC